MEKIYLVGHCGCEHDTLISVHKTYDGAFKAWDKLRLELLEDAKSRLNSEFCGQMYAEMVTNLSCTDPKAIENFPHETPYLREDVLRD